MSPKNTDPVYPLPPSTHPLISSTLFKIEIYIDSSWIFSTAKTAAGKRALKRKTEARVVEQHKQALFVKGSTTSQDCTDALLDLVRKKLWIRRKEGERKGRECGERRLKAKEAVKP